MERATEVGVINFYRASEPFGEMSNFFFAPFKLGGKEWPTSEHFFQAAKFFRTDPAWAERIRVASSAGEAARMGRDRSHPIEVEWWDNVGRDEAMRLALMAKFTQNPRLQTLLATTKPHMLVEHTANDSYWGDGGDGSGKNMLGTLLMEVRDIMGHAEFGLAVMYWKMVMRLLGVQPVD